MRRSAAISISHAEDIVADSNLSPFDFCREMRAELGYLGSDDDLAVSLRGVVLKIALMIVLGAIERLERDHLGD